MINALPEDLQLLWKLAGVVEPLSPDNNWNTYFESIGLILLTPKEDYGRDCLIPINSLTFATTGGGSVHYSLLALDGNFTNDSPVIMTVPNCDKSNMIVGDNFRDFLGLGIRTGYFVLEQLAFDYFDKKLFEKTLLPHQTNEFHRDDYFTAEKEALLLELEKTYLATYWINPKEKLMKLEELYINLLNIDKSVLL